MTTCYYCGKAPEACKCAPTKNTDTILEKYAPAPPVARTSITEDEAKQVREAWDAVLPPYAEPPPEVRIVCHRPHEEPQRASNGFPLINGLAPSLEDCQVFINGTPVTGIESIEFTAKGGEPTRAVITFLGAHLDVVPGLTEIRGKDDTEPDRCGNRVLSLGGQRCDRQKGHEGEHHHSSSGLTWDP